MAWPKMTIRTRSTVMAPQACSECPFLFRPTQLDRCWFYSKDFDEPQGLRPSWCYLTQIKIVENP
jgi:hypothetical protein